MTPKDIEILAHDNRPMPEFSSLTDICLYQAFANLYNRLNLKQIVRDQAKTEKKQILKTYAQIKSENERYIAVCGEYQDNIRKAGMLLSDIEKSQDIREIALKSCECIGIMTDDSDFLKRQMKKFVEDKRDKIRR